MVLGAAAAVAAVLYLGKTRTGRDTARLTAILPTPKSVPAFSGKAQPVSLRP